MIPMTQGNDSWSLKDYFRGSEVVHYNCTSLLGFPIFGPVAPFISLGLLTDVQPQLPEPDSAFEYLISSYGLSYDSNISFPLSQYEFTCPLMSRDLVNGSWTSMLGPDSIYANHSKLAEQSSSGSGFFLDTNATLASQFDGPQPMVFGSFFNSDVTLWHCALHVNTRNITTECIDTPNTGSDFGCVVSSMGVPTQSFSTPFSNFTIAASQLGLWPLVDTASPGTSSFTELFLAQGHATELDLRLVDLSQLDNITFATRLTTIFNTWIQTAQPRNTEPQKSDLSRFQPYHMNSTFATPLQFYPFTIITCDWFYFTVLTLTSIFLLLCCLLSIWLRHKLSTPDILGYVSSSTNDNPYISLPGVQPGSGSALDGLSRAKLLAKMQVQIRDVQTQEEMGKFALTNESQPYRRVGRERRFV
jgi:hypothetical protein